MDRSRFNGFFSRYTSEFAKTAIFKLLHKRSYFEFERKQMDSGKPHEKNELAAECTPKIVLYTF